MRCRKITVLVLSVLLLCVVLSACGGKSAPEEITPFSGGEFYCALLAHSDGTPVEIYTFNNDGTGTASSKAHTSNFTWKLDENVVRTTIPVMNSTYYRFTGKYLVDPINQWSGSIPSGSTFDTTLTLQSTFDLKAVFKKDGTVAYTVDGKTRNGTYTVDGDILTMSFDSAKQYYAIVDGSMYSNFLQPIEN